MVFTHIIPKNAEHSKDETDLDGNGKGLVHSQGTVLQPALDPQTTELPSPFL